MPSSVRKHVPQPTRKTEYAREAGESAHPELWDSLAGAWSPGLGSTGSVLFDESGNRHQGVLTNMEPSDWILDGGRTALDFGGTDEYADVGAITSNVFTYSAWIRTSGTTGSRTLFGDSAVSDGYQFRLEDDETLTFIHQDQLLLGQTTDTITNAIWQHAVLTHKADKNFAIYINGKESLSGSHARTIVESNKWIGARLTLSEYFIGSMDDVFIHHRVLNASEVKKLYNLGRGGIYEKKPVEYYLAPLATLDQTRMSTFNIGMPWRSGSMVNPLDTGFTAANRQASGFMYAGILAQAPSGATLPPLLEGNMLIGGFQNMSGGL